MPMMILLELPSEFSFEDNLGLTEALLTYSIYPQLLNSTPSNLLYLLHYFCFLHLSPFQKHLLFKTLFTYLLHLFQFLSPLSFLVLYNNFFVNLNIIHLPLYFQKSNFEIQDMSDLHSMAESNQPRKKIDVIQPNTTRVLEMKRIRQEKERQKAKERQLQQKKKEEQKRREQTLQRLKMNQQKQKQSQFQQLLRIKQQQAKQSSTLVGKFGHMINDLKTNTTNLQFTISGLDLRPAQVKVLLTKVQANSSLKGLTMSRKKLTDVQGKQISERLIQNGFLERLQLEGNQLGPQTLLSLAQLLKVNETIRLLDLEGNNLIKGKDGIPNHKGIESLVEALKQNETILSINLNGTGLDKQASKKLRQLMEVNSTIILLDIENNPDMNLEDVIEIQNQLVKNKQEHDDERYMEFIERKRMRREEDISGVLMLNRQTKKLRTEAIQLNIKTKKEQLDQDWQQYLQKQEIARQKEIIKMEKEAGAKKGKKKKK